MDKTLDLDELERVAKRATQARRYRVGPKVYARGHGVPLLTVNDLGPSLGQQDEDATYIATFDPPTILTLIAAARPAVVSDEVVERMKKLSERLMQMAQDRQDWADHPEIGGKKPMLNSHLRGKRYGYSHAAQLIDAALALLPGGEGEGSSRSSPSRTTQEPQSPTPCDLEGEKRLLTDNIVCPWCQRRIIPGEPTATSDGERMHLACAAEDADNATFDRDMGDW